MSDQICQTSTLLRVIDNLYVGAYESKQTHASMCILAARWLIRNKKCRSVLVERGMGEGEMPDVIGFYFDDSFLIEAKENRQDFRKDREKPHRTTPEIGMGKYRWYICPKDLIAPEEIPDGWGLLYVGEKGTIKTIKNAVAFPVYNRDKEFIMLTSALSSPWKLFQHWTKESLQRLANVHWISKKTEQELHHFCARVSANIGEECVTMTNKI